MTWGRLLLAFDLGLEHRSVWRESHRSVLWRCTHGDLNLSEVPNARDNLLASSAILVIWAAEGPQDILSEEVR